MHIVHSPPTLQVLPPAKVFIENPGGTHLESEGVNMWSGPLDLHYFVL